jgi:glutamate 5-kinase
MKWIRVPTWKRAVVKVGSSIVAPEGKGCSTKYLLAIARFINESRDQGKEVILVSSGAVAAGVATQEKASKSSHRSIPEKQALAAIGQNLLMMTWSRFFDFPCAQLLLTYGDIFNRKRFVNAKNTLMELLKMHTLPIVNENDTVAVEELKVGDNDNLAALVAILAEADLLLICSDVDGLYTADPRLDSQATHLPIVEKIDKEIYALASESIDPLATGGMQTKIDAADKATSRGIDTIIMNGKKSGYFEELLQGKLFGTIFHRTTNPVAAKKRWMLHALPVSGRIMIDKGATKALSAKGASLLPSGVIELEGKFLHGDPVEIVTDQDGQRRIIAKGITQYSHDELDKVKGKQSNQIESILGYYYTDVVIQRDDLVLVE